MNFMRSGASPDLSEDFHIYAVKRTAEEIIWYFDGRCVASASPSADMQKPMYLLINLGRTPYGLDPGASTSEAQRRTMTTTPLLAKHYQFVGTLGSV